MSIEQLPTGCVIGLLRNPEGIPCTETDSSPTILFGKRTTLSSTSNDKGVGWDALDIESIHEVTVERSFYCRKADFPAVSSWLASLNGNTYNAGIDGQASINGVFSIDGEIEMTSHSPTLGLVRSRWIGYILDVNYKLPPGMTWEQESETTWLVKMNGNVVLRVSSSGPGDRSGLMLKGGAPVAWRDLPAEIQSQVKRAYTNFPRSASDCIDGKQYYEAVYRPIILSVNGEEAMRWWVLVYADGYSTKVLRCRKVYYGSDNGKSHTHNTHRISHVGTITSVYQTTVNQDTGEDVIGNWLYDVTYTIPNIGPFNMLSHDSRLFYIDGQVNTNSISEEFKEAGTANWTSNAPASLTDHVQRTVAITAARLLNEMKTYIYGTLGYDTGQDAKFFSYSKLSSYTGMVQNFVRLPASGLVAPRYNDATAIAAGRYEAQETWMMGHTINDRVYTFRLFVPQTASLERDGVAETVDLDAVFGTCINAIWAESSVPASTTPDQLEFKINGGKYGNSTYKYYGHVGYVFFEDELSGDQVRNVQNAIQLYWEVLPDGGVRLRADHKLAGPDALLTLNPNNGG